MTKVLITGATGYIGRKIVELLVGQVEDIRILTLNRTPEKAVQLMPYAECRHADAYDADAIQAFLPDIVLHLAAFSTPACDSSVIDNLLKANIEYGVWLLDQLTHLPKAPHTFVNTGSFAEFRLGEENGIRPAYLYTATKAAFRRLLQFYRDLTGMRVITAVPYSVYGNQTTRKQLMDYIMESLDAGLTVDMTLGEQVLDFVHVSDVAQFYVNVVKSPHSLPEGDYHLGTGKGTSIRALAQLMEQLSGKKANINWGGRPYRPLDVMNAVAPADKTLSAFWKPEITLTQGLKDLLTQ